MAEKTRSRKLGTGVPSLKVGERESFETSFGKLTAHKKPDGTLSADIPSLCPENRFDELSSRKEKNL
jgi:hypothetical protein